MGKRVVVPSSEEHIPDDGKESPFFKRNVAGHF